MTSLNRDYRSSRPARGMPLGRNQRDPRGEPRDGTDRLRAPGDTSERAEPIQETTSQSDGGPSLSGQAQAPTTPPQTGEVKDPGGPTASPAAAPEPPSEPVPEQAGGTSPRAETAEGSGTKSSSKVASPTSLTKKERREINAALKGFIDARAFEEKYRDHALILLVALVVGANADTVAKAADLNRDKVVRPIAKRLRDGGIWKNGVTQCQWFDDDWKVGNTAFLLDVLCAAGLIRREPDNGEKYLNNDGTPHTRPGQEAP